MSDIDTQWTAIVEFPGCSIKYLVNCQQIILIIAVRNYICNRASLSCDAKFKFLEINSLFIFLLSFFVLLSWMPRRVLWLCWPRPALKLANQTPPPLPSWPLCPPAAWETRSPPVGHPSLESSTSPLRTNPASSLTPSHQVSLERMF